MINLLKPPGNKPETDYRLWTGKITPLKEVLHHHQLQMLDNQQRIQVPILKVYQYYFSCADFNFHCYQNTCIGYCCNIVK